MKLKAVSITNMHQIPFNRPTTYDLQDITYFIGPNGAGKSTVLQAIQLALLGYIPGYDKTNSGIIKHSNDGKFLEVSVLLADGDSATCTIWRRWEKSGNSVKSHLKTTPIGFDPSTIIGDLELPVFNFNEFKDMTANKLKDWFINFLPKDQFDIDWKEYLTNELGSRSMLLSDELMDLVLGTITELEGQGLKGVELVRRLNDELKVQQSYNKASLDRLQNTINSLIYYQDVESADEDEIKKHLDDLNTLHSELIRYNAQQQQIQNAQSTLVQLGHPDIVKETEDAWKAVTKANDALQAVEKECSELGSKYTALATQLMMYSGITSDVCPYTSNKCAEISAVLEENNVKKAQIQSEMDLITPKMQEYDSQIRALKAEYHDKYSFASHLGDTHQLIETLKSTIEAEQLPIPTSKTEEEIKQEIADLQGQLVKIEANKQFKQMSDTITKDKYQAENNLEVLKIWVNSTGANGLQTYMMEKPFESLAADLSTYLTSIYNQPISGKFILKEKANSFSFGMGHADQNDFIEFDLLSSGEKCLFTVAMIMCLINRSNAELKLILADDMFDHLDDENADRFFAGLASMDIQCIMAGVKECKNKDICVAIGGK